MKTNDIITAEMEAYASSKVREALNDAYLKLRELEKQLLTEAPHVPGPQAASFAANQIRALMPKEAHSMTSATQPSYTPLDQEPRATIPTREAAYHLNRKMQTLHIWACKESGPIRPVRVGGRLAWRVADIRRVLNGEADWGELEGSTKGTTCHATAVYVVQGGDKQ